MSEIKKKKNTLTVVNKNINDKDEKKVINELDDWDIIIKEDVLREDILQKEKK
jgi:hypothetical protein